MIVLISVVCGGATAFFMSISDYGTAAVVTTMWVTALVVFE